MSRGFKIKALGEVAIRCDDIERMAAFYRDVLGLEPLEGGYGAGIRFFRIGAGYSGHTTVLALFAKDAGNEALHARSDSAPVTGAGSSLHHVALTVDFAAQGAVMDWYDRQGVDYTLQEFGWIGWRGVFARDPEGNTVELVAYDRSLLESGEGAEGENEEMA